MSAAPVALRHDAAALGRLLADLVAIDSVNPDLVPGGAGETEIAAFVADWLRAAGLEVEVLDGPAGADPPRPSVIGVARGTGGGRALMLNGHLDTVGVEGMADAHAPRVRGGRLYGRGAFDMKGGLAACLVAGAAAVGAGLAGDVVVAAVSDEEFASVGAQAVAERFAGRVDAALLSEPTALAACVAHRDFAWATIRARGRAAHGSRPDLGVDAIVHMGAVLAEIGALDDRFTAMTRHPLLGRDAVHASLSRVARSSRATPSAAPCRSSAARSPARRARISRRSSPARSRAPVSARPRSTRRGR